MLSVYGCFSDSKRLLRAQGKKLAIPGKSFAFAAIALRNIMRTVAFCCAFVICANLKSDANLMCICSLQRVKIVDTLFNGLNGLTKRQNPEMHQRNDISFHLDSGRFSCDVR